MGDVAPLWRFGVGQSVKQKSNCGHLSTKAATILPLDHNCAYGQITDPTMLAVVRSFDSV